MTLKDRIALAEAEVDRYHKLVSKHDGLKNRRAAKRAFDKYMIAAGKLAFLRTCKSDEEANKFADFLRDSWRGSGRTEDPAKKRTVAAFAPDDSKLLYRRVREGQREGTQEGKEPPMKMNDVIEGLQILQKYFDDPNGYNTAAEHDQIFVYPTNKPVSPEDVARLRELGWFQPDAGSRGVEAGKEPYEPEDGWTAYT
jgi:hypothetical protein